MVDTKSIPDVVTRRRETVHQHYPTRAPFVISIALWVLRIIGVRDISPHDLIRFLYLAHGDDVLWAHDGQKYIYNNGAFTIFIGLLPESLQSRRQKYAHCFDGAMWCICKRGGLNGRIDLETMKALAGSLAAISRASVSEIGDVEGRKGEGKSGRNDRLRSWLRAPFADADMGAPKWRSPHQ